MEIVKNQLKPMTLASQVESYILNVIKEHKLRPGDNIPSEVQITSDLNISRGVVREAFRSLNAKGLIEVASGKKPRVKQLDSSVLSTILDFVSVTEQVSVTDILEVRYALEISCAALAALKITPEEAAALREEMKTITSTMGADDESFVAHDSRFHSIIAKASHNPLFFSMIEALHKQIDHSIHEGLSAQPSEQEKHTIIDLHDEICKRICAHDELGAKTAMARHFEIVQKALAH